MKAFKIYLEIVAKPIAIPYLQGCILERAREMKCFELT